MSKPYQYTGREADAAGLYYYRARYYSPMMAGFISEDPITFGGGQLSFYAYVGGDPENYVDPLGLVEWSGTMTTFGASAIVGGSFSVLKLTSKCVNGKKAHVKAYATGPTGGVEVEGAPTVGATQSSVAYLSDTS